MCLLSVFVLCFVLSLCCVWSFHLLCEGPLVCDPNTPSGCKSRKCGTCHVAIQTQTGTWWTCTGIPCHYNYSFLSFYCKVKLCVDFYLTFSAQLRALGTVPMCSTQMERMFNTTRIPGIETGEQMFRSVLYECSIITESQIRYFPLSSTQH